MLGNWKMICSYESAYHFIVLGDEPILDTPDSSRGAKCNFLQDRLNHCTKDCVGNSDTGQDSTNDHPLVSQNETVA